MVEVIWPLSVASCKPQAGGVLSLRRYIEETLRRSRTSYSTLQVALYYLVLIMPCVPKSDFTMQQSVDSPSVRALQCGRRMFLAALILASKYLQDRNYSAKAWSKMSGLKVAEINLNERAFLEAVSWKLHIPDHVFKRWTDVVLRYTPSQLPPPAGQSFSTAETKSCWKNVIPTLTPDLDLVAPAANIEGSPCMLAVVPAESYPSLPSFLEPQPEVRPRTPTLSVGYLPTPRLTPPPVVNTPAVSVGSMESFRSVGQLSRRSSFAASEISTVLSPISILSDVSRLSPASSVSSISSNFPDHQFKNVSVESHTTSMIGPKQFTAYDAQPKASRAVKRSQAEAFDFEDQESSLQSQVKSLLAKQGSKEMPIVLIDEDCANTTLAADVVKDQAFRYINRDTHVASVGDRKRMRMCYSDKPALDLAYVTAY